MGNRLISHHSAAGPIRKLGFVIPSPVSFNYIIWPTTSFYMEMILKAGAEDGVNLPFGGIMDLKNFNWLP